MPNKILLVADSCLDVFYYGHCKRLCPDVPAVVVDEELIVENGGMGQNVRNNIISLGGKVDIITNPDWYNNKKIRICDETSNYIFCRWDTKYKTERVKDLDKIDYSQYKICAVSDYNKGFILSDDVKYLASKLPVFLDTKKRITKDFESCKYIKVNHLEYTNSKEYLTPLLESKIIETLGARGCRLGDDIFPVKELEVRSVSGAGDSFFAGLLVKYVETEDIKESIKFANKVSSIVITKKGVSTVSLEELNET